jgi:rhamnosyltransferase
MNIPKDSIIVRTKNEERWIDACLSSIYKQNYDNYEVILVDNDSADGTVAKASKFPIINVSLRGEFKPGKAINDGIRASNGEYIVIISGHCIPTNELWLSNLVSNLADETVAGVYGRQEPLSFTSALDKRDLLITFGLDKRFQKKDSFFHNANSALRRDIWEKYPFDESVRHIEDRVWGVKVIEGGYSIVYEPSASVYHHHGIHHRRNLPRAERIVQIMEDLHGPAFDLAKIYSGEVGESKIKTAYAIIPVRGASIEFGGKNLLSYTIRYFKACAGIDHVFVSTDDINVAEIAKKNGALVPFIRPSSLSESYVDLPEVLEFSLKKIEERYPIPDIVVVAQENYPFRNKSMVSEMISKLIAGGLDTVVASAEETKRIWITSDSQEPALVGDEGFIPSFLRSQRTYLDLQGLACITHPEFIRDRTIYGKNLGFYVVSNSLNSLEIQSAREFEQMLPVLESCID